MGVERKDVPRNEQRRDYLKKSESVRREETSGRGEDRWLLRDEREKSGWEMMMIIFGVHRGVGVGGSRTAGWERHAITVAWGRKQKGDARN